MSEGWRWGAEDEAGALNYVDAAKVCAATALVREGRVLSLAQSLSAKTPVPPLRGAIQHFMSRDGGDYAAGARSPGGFQFADDALFMHIHSGTHVDALCHAWHDDTLYNGFPASGVTSRGAARCGVEKMPPVVTRGVLIDLVGNGPALDDGEAVGRARLETALGELSLEAGDAVLIRTGWQKSRTNSDRDFNAEPGIDAEAAHWLAEAGVALVGADNFAVEVLPFAAGTVFPVHQLLIRDYGVSLLENLVLAPLAAERARTFLFVMAPLPIVGGTGSPVTPLAIL